MEISITHPVDMTKHVLTQGFGENPDIYRQFKVKGIPLQGHNGHDFASPIAHSWEVYAAQSGQVLKVAFEWGGFGSHVWIRHRSPGDLPGSGFRTLYAHLSEVKVWAGEVITRGSFIGFTGNTGFSTGIHLHFGLYPDGEPALNGYGGAVDPTPYYGEGSQFTPTGTLEYTAKPAGSTIFIFHTLKPKKKTRKK